MSPRVDADSQQRHQRYQRVGGGKNQLRRRDRTPILARRPVELPQGADYQGGDYGECAQRQHQLQHAKKLSVPPLQVCENEEKEPGCGEQQGAPRIRQNADAMADHIAGQQQRGAERE